MYEITAESVNEAARERLRQIESGEVKPKRIVDDAETRALRKAYIRYLDEHPDEDIEIF